MNAEFKNIDLISYQRTGELYKLGNAVEKKTVLRKNECKKSFTAQGHKEHSMPILISWSKSMYPTFIFPIFSAEKAELMLQSFKVSLFHALLNHAVQTEVKYFLSFLHTIYHTSDTEPASILNHNQPHVRQIRRDGRVS